jgi:hypothetical protein
MNLSDTHVQRRAEADRREVTPPIQVETATWSNAGQLDWWVREQQQWWYVRSTDGRHGGSKLLIFVPRAAHSRDDAHPTNPWRL